MKRTTCSLALALVGLHVLDDNFLQPNPGTSAADHLVSGLVPLILLSAVLVLCSRARPGWCGTAQLLAGYFGVLIGTEALYYASRGAASDDDFTGFVALPAGLVLLILGARTLWTSRRRQDPLVRRYARRTVATVGAVAAVQIVLFPTAVAYVVTHAARAGIPDANLGVAPENVTFTTSDGLRLKGWFVAP